MRLPDLPPRWHSGQHLEVELVALEHPDGTWRMSPTSDRLRDLVAKVGRGREVWPPKRGLDFLVALKAKTVRVQIARR